MTIKQLLRTRKKNVEENFTVFELQQSFEIFLAPDCLFELTKLQIFEMPVLPTH